MSGNTIEYLIRLKDDFTAKMQGAAAVGAKGGAAIAQGMAVAVAAGLKFKDQISAGWDVLNGNYEALGTVLGALPGPLGEIGQIAGETLGKMIKETEEAAEGYRKLSAATGASVEFLSGFKEAADDVRVSGEAVDAALIKFARGLGGVKDASEGVAESGKGIAQSLADIGVNANDSEGKVRPLADLLPDVADAFARMADGPAKTALAIQLFGKQGAELIPILNKGKEGIAEMAKAAEEAGLTMSTDTIQAIDKLKQAQDALGDSWGALSRKIGTAAIPALTSIVDALNYYTGTSGTMTEAFQTVNTELEKFYMAGRVTDEGIKRIAATGANGVEVLKRFAEGGAGSNAVTQQWAQELIKLHPELLNVNDATGTATESHALLVAAQKKVAAGSAEYKDRTQQLTDVMSKRDDQLDDINEKEKALTEAYKKGFITADQYAQGQLHLMDATAKVKDTFDGAAGKIKDGAEATEKMDKAAQGAAQRQHDFEQAMKDAATASEGLKEKLGNLTDGIGGTPEKLDRAKRALIGFQLATGQLTQDQFEQKAIGELLTQQYVKNATTYEKFLENATKYYRGEISGAQALENVGATRNAFAVGYVKDMRAIETASGTAQGSELAFFDTLRVVGGSYKVYTSDAKNLAQAQIQHADSILGIEKNQKLLNEAEKNGTISKLQNAEAQVYLNQQLGVVNENLRKSEKAYNNGQPVVKSWAKVISESGQSVAEWEAQMAKAGLTTEQVKQVVNEVSGKTVKISGDTTGLDDPKKEMEMLKSNADKGATVNVTGNTAGLTEPVNQARSDAEKPITVPVDFKLGASPSFGVDKPATPSMTLPVAFDTTGLDKQAAAVKDQLAKLGPAGVSVSLDTVSFDQSMLRVQSALTGLPDESIAITINVPDSVKLPDFSSFSGKTAYLYADYSDVTKSVDVAQKAIDGLTGKTVDLKLNSSGSVALPTNSSISVHVVGDTADAIDAIQAVIDKAIPEKTAYISGDDTGAMASINTVNEKAVNLKTLVIAGVNTDGSGASAGVSTAKSMPFALDAVAAVNAADVYMKTLVIAGNNQHAMGAIANVKTAMDTLKDKTVYLTVINRIIDQKDDGGGGGGGGRDNNFTNNAARGNRPVIYLAETINVRNDLDLAMITRAVDSRITQIFDR